MIPTQCPTTAPGFRLPNAAYWYRRYDRGYFPTDRFYSGVVFLFPLPMWSSPSIFQPYELPLLKSNQCLMVSNSSGIGTMLGITLTSKLPIS